MRIYIFLQITSFELRLSSLFLHRSRSDKFDLLLDFEKRLTMRLHANYTFVVSTFRFDNGGR